MILGLAGGVGGARMARGLGRVLSPGELLVAVNTGDDFTHLGLHISPDLDTVIYTMAGRNDPVQGWGLAGESWQCMDALGALGGATWFRLGDRDIATHLLRTAALSDGLRLSEVTARLCDASGLTQRVVPMSDEPVRTLVDTEEGELAFQDYFVRLQCKPRFRGLRFAGAETANQSPALAAAWNDATLTGIVICPSNPYLSIGPLLAVPAAEAALRARRVPAVAVSPIIGGAAVKGPLAKIMSELGREVSSLEIARFYAGLVDGLVIDVADASQQPAIEALGLEVLVTPTLMRDPAGEAALAEQVLAFAQTIHRADSNSPRKSR